mgnify:CR=1 FL=1
MTTGLAVGETFAMNLSHSVRMKRLRLTLVTVNFKEFTLSDTPQEISGEVKGANIKVYTTSGVQLKDFDASGMKLTSANIFKSKAIRNLNLNNNEISEIDLSGNLKI